MRIQTTTGLKVNYFLPVWSIFSFLLVTTSILSSSGSNWTNSGEQKMSGRLPKSGNSVLDHPLRQLRSGEWWPWTNVNKIILLHFWLLSPLCVRSVSGPTFGKLSYFKPHLCSALYLSVAMVNHSINAPLVMSFFFFSDSIILLLTSCFGSENSEIPISGLVNSDIISQKLKRL